MSLSTGDKLGPYEILYEKELAASRATLSKTLEIHPPPVVCLPCKKEPAASHAQVLDPVEIDPPP